MAQKSNPLIGPPQSIQYVATIARQLAPRPGMRVLDLGAGIGRHHGVGLFRYWPEAIAALDTFPSLARVRTAFAAAGFSYVTLEPVRQVTAPSLAAIAATARRESHTPLMLITDSAYEAGLARLRAAAATEQGPVIDTLDLLVLRADRATTTASPPAKPGSGQSAELLFRRNLDVNLETGGRQHPARKPLPGSVGITSSLALQRPVGDGRIRTRRPPAPKGIYGRARAEPPPYLDRGGPGER